MKSIPEYLANFLWNYCSGDEYAEYRIEAYAHWRSVYGDDVVKKVRAIIKSKADAKAKK